MDSTMDRPRPFAASEDQIRRHLDRVLASAEFAGAPRQQAFLRFIVAESLAGRGHELKEILIAASVYDRPAGYDPRIDSTVRVEASKLRQRLHQFYEREGASDLLRLSIPKGSYQPLIELAALPEPVPVPVTAPSGHWRTAFLATAAMLSLALGWLWFRPRGSDSLDPSAMKLTRLTERGSFSAAPALSPKGDYVVYASDRETGGVLNLWRQPLDGGPPARLTRSGSNHHTPSVSPDGSTLVFRSDEHGGVLATMPAAGGEARPLRESAGGRNPRFGPRGSALVYWVPRDQQTADYGRVFLDPIDAKYGHGPVRLFGDFAHAAFPIWSDDGARVLTLGTWHSDVPDKEFDAWIVELDRLHPKGPARKTGLFPALLAAGLYRSVAERSQIEVAGWRGDWLYLTLPTGGAFDLFRIRLRAGGGEISGTPQRLTFGAGGVKEPRVAANGRIVFARSEITYDLFSLAVPAGREPGSGLRRHTSETGLNFRPAVLASGNAGVWEKRDRGSEGQIWFFDLVSGARQQLGLGDARTYSHALISPGRLAAYRVNEPGLQPIYLQPVSGGPAKRICDNCGTPSDWTADGRHMFYITGGRPVIVGLLDIATGRHLDLIKHPSHDLFGARARLDSAGNGFVAFYADNGPRTRQILLAPLRGFQPAPQQDWIAVTDGAHWDQSPAWSPDGRTLYFVNRHDGFACIMARMLNSATGQPIGASWAVQHFHSPGRTLMRSVTMRGSDALWVAGQRLYFTLDSPSSDLWTISSN
jgi:hypothetical protein